MIGEDGTEIRILSAVNSRTLTIFPTRWEVHQGIFYRKDITLLVKGLLVKVTQRGVVVKNVKPSSEGGQY